MTRRVQRPRTLNETLADNRKAEQLWAGMFGKPLRDDAPMPKEKAVRIKSEIATESQEQRAFVRWWRLQYPSIRIFAIPNGGMRDAITGAILKAEGALPGVLDLFCPRLLLWVEMKRSKGGVVSDEQDDFGRYLVQECGHTVIFGHGCEDAIAQVKLFMKYREGK